MHEMALAQGILDVVLDTATQHSAIKVNRIKLLVGQMTHVEPEALKFGFVALAAGTIAATAELDITIVPLMGCCEDCQQQFAVEGFHFICPHCQSAAVNIVSGRELRVEHLEVD